MIEIGDLVWTPDETRKETAHITQFMRWLARTSDHRFEDYGALWRWSTDNIADFWEAVWRYFDVASPTPYRCVLENAEMPNAEWFPGTKVNYAERLLAPGSDHDIAVYAADETGITQRLTRGDLRAQVARLAEAMRQIGVRPGDRVAAYLPNIPEAVIGFLAAASIGAIWSSCSPDFGADSVIDRFGQIEPKLLFVTDGYIYGGKRFDRRSQAADIVAALPSVKSVIRVSVLGEEPNEIGGSVAWSDLMEEADIDPAKFVFEDTEFEAPLWIVYSSGTTGLPKPFVHGHGGVLLESLKFMHFHMDLHEGDCFFFFTTTGWVMWNILVSGLITGAGIVLFDGNPLAPDPLNLWRVVSESGTTFFGASPTYVGHLLANNIHPNQDMDLAALRSILLGGSPVMPEHMAWCYENLGTDLWVTSQSGGTDVASAFVGGVPILPVHAGEIQARLLGVDVHAMNEDGEPVIGEVGELVVRKPMPSMPLCFWGDGDGSRYRESYFTEFPGMWRHGDYFLVNERGGCQILGRSDSTLNRYGVRIGTAEIYRAVEALDEIEDSIIVNLDLPGGRFYMPLFVVTAENRPLDADLRERINAELRSRYSPRHVPDEIHRIEAVPYTLTGKKMEVPVRKILAGASPDKVASRDAMRNPEALAFFETLARERAATMS